MQKSADAEIDEVRFDVPPRFCLPIFFMGQRSRTALLRAALIWLVSNSPHYSLPVSCRRRRGTSRLIWRSVWSLFNQQLCLPILCGAPS